MALAYDNADSERSDVLPFADQDGAERLHVHLCEASRVQRAIIKQLLEDSGFRVSASGHANDSLESMRLAPPDIFVTAIELPDISGLEVCWLIKTCPDTEHVHTLVMSASGQEDKLTESLDAGADDFLRKPIEPNELKARLRAAARIVRLQQRLRGEAQTDALTGAANRRAFMRTLHREHSRAQDGALVYSVLMIDLDFFKKINDTHGHASGDRVLKKAVQTLNAELSPPAMLGRLGGEEFAAILPGQSREQARQTAERLRTALEAMCVSNDDGQAIAVTASLGAASLAPGDIEQTAESMLSFADAALYKAKQGGRNQVCAHG